MCNVHFLCKTLFWRKVHPFLVKSVLSVQNEIFLKNALLVQILHELQTSLLVQSALLVQCVFLVQSALLVESALSGEISRVLSDTISILSNFVASFY